MTIFAIESAIFDDLEKRHLYELPSSRLRAEHITDKGFQAQFRHFGALDREALGQTLA